MSLFCCGGPEHSPDPIIPTALGPEGAEDGSSAIEHILGSSKILTNRSDALALQSMFPQERLMKSRPRLLYRATRDGYYRRDFYTRCVDRGPTLILCRVVDNAFLFGCFASVSWPIPPKAKLPAREMDESECEFKEISQSNNPLAKETFLFSLRNHHGRPVKLIQNESAPVTIASASIHGPVFGKDITLMRCGDSALAASGNFASAPSECYIFDPAYVHENENVGWKYDRWFLGGSPEFGCEEIECWAMEECEQWPSNYRYDGPSATQTPIQSRPQTPRGGSSTRPPSPTPTHREIIDTSHNNSRSNGLEIRQIQLDERPNNSHESDEKRA